MTLVGFQKFTSTFSLFKGYVGKVMYMITKGLCMGIKTYFVSVSIISVEYYKS
jgi:hypothetical protein